MKLPALQADPAERERRQRLKEIVAYNDELRVKEVRGDSLTTDAKLVTEGHEALSVGQFTDRAIGLLERAEVLRHDAQRKAREAVEQGQLAELRADPSSVLGSAEELNRLKYQFDAMARPLVQVAYALNIDAAALDDFIRTGNPDLVAEAIRVLRQIQGEDLRRRQPAAPAETGETNWRDVQRRLLVMCDQGEAYTNLRDLMQQTGCGSTSTVSKAIDRSKTLQKWRDQQANRTRRPRATGLTAVVTDNTAQTAESDPSDVLTDEDIDRAMHRLIEEAGPDEKARLNGLSENERRALVRVFYEQNLDQEPSPLEDDVPGVRPRKLIQHKRV